jgi:hypothetical protein
MTIPTLPHDKCSHVLYGASVFAAFGAVAALAGAPYPRSVAMASAVVVGAGKELADHLANLRAKRDRLPPPHSVEWLDALATVAGAALCWAAAAVTEVPNG